MMNPRRNNIIKFTILALIIIILSIVIFILLANNNHQSLENNKDEVITESISIDNFDQLYRNVSEDTKETIQRILYRTAKQNTEQPKLSGTSAQIRTTVPYLYTYDFTTYIYHGDFIVDIPDLQQSYRVTFNYSDSPNTITTGYRVLVTCLTKSPRIYPEFNCHDLNPDNITEENL